MNPKLAEVFIFAVINLCSGMELTREQSLMALHIAMFGDSDKEPLEEKFTLQDFGGGTEGGET